MTPDTENDRLNYQRDGAICMRGVVDAGFAVQLFEEADRLERHRNEFRANMDMVDRLQGYWDCVSPLPAIAGALMQSNRVRFYNDHLFVKKAGASVPSNWHQDLPYWPFRGEQIIAAWIALTPVRREAGALQYVRGSHRRDSFYRPLPVAIADPNHPDYLALEICPDYFDPVFREREEFLTWDMEPGDVLWHHPLAIHGAYSNNSPSNPIRAGLTVRFLGDDVIWDPRGYLRPATKVPNVDPGQHPDDDTAFPLLWTAS